MIRQQTAVIFQKKLNEHLKPQVMKKTALTIGLFSLVMVATSFANPEVSSKLSASMAKIDPPVMGSGSGGSGATNQGRKKVDFAAVGNDANVNSHLSSFDSDSQSKRMSVKID